MAPSGPGCGARIFRAGSLLRCADVSLVATVGLSSCRLRTSLPWGMWDLSSWTRDKTHIPDTGKWTLNHWACSRVLEVAGSLVPGPSTHELLTPAVPAPGFPGLTRTKDSDGVAEETPLSKRQATPASPGSLLSRFLLWLSLATGDALKISPGTCSNLSTWLLTGHHRWTMETCVWLQ